MRILLVSPKSSVWNSRKHIHMGLGYLAGALLAAGYKDITLFDAEVEEEPISALLAPRPFDVVGVSSPTPLIYEAWEVAALAKAQGAITMLGGPHPTLMPEESMGRTEVDLVGRGEAEETLVEIVREIERRQPVGSEPLLAACDLSLIKGVSRRDSSGQV